MTRRVALAVLPLFLFAAAVAQADTKTVTVPGTVVFTQGQKPGKPGSCSAPVFVQWKDVPNTTSAVAHFVRSGKPATESRPAPFDDTYTWVATFTASPGTHWINVGVTWRNGSVPSTCADFTEKNKAVIGTTATVDLSVTVDAAACTKAKAAATRKKTAVAKLQARVAKAKGREKARLRRALKAARSARDRAVELVAVTC